jgi:serine/threonine protein kinase
VSHEEVFSSRIDFHALSAISHTHIVRLHDYGWVEGGAGRRVAAQEYLHGGDLTNFMLRWMELAPADLDRRRGPNPATTLSAKFPWGLLPAADVRTVLIQLFTALEFCHAMGFGHMDLKPDNVMLDRHGTFKLVDFGLAIFFTKPPPAAGASSTGSEVRYYDAVGTYGYMAPEVLLLALDPADREKHGLPKVSYLPTRAGMMAFELFTGMLPYPACHDPATNSVNKVEMLRYRHQVPPFRRSEAVPYLRGVHEFPVEFEALVAYLTAVDPSVPLFSRAVLDCFGAEIRIHRVHISIQSIDIENLSLSLSLSLSLL